MKQKGFTLIELLAVIILIGLLATLITSKMKSSIDDSKEATYYASSTSIVKGLENYYFEQKMKGNFTGCTYTPTNNTCTGFSFDGKKPDDGELTLDIDGNINGNLIFNNSQQYQVENNEIIKYDKINYKLVN